MEVFKFGGASIKDAVSIKNVPVVLAHFKNKKIVVIISAMGKTTNALEQLLRSYFNRQEDTHSHLRKIKDFHFSIIKELFPEEIHPVYADINHLFDKLETAIAQPPDANFDYQYDRIVHFGEVISSKILWHFLNYAGVQAAWMDITRVLVTNNEFRNAKVNWQKTQEQIQKHLVPVIDNNPIIVLQGFIGKSETGSVVTLGREGSDYSAAIVAYCTDAESVTIWKDVEGVLNADPKYFADTQIIEQISYADAVEMAYYGASVIHPKTIKPLENKKIPLYVKPFAKPSAAGTVIKSTPVKLPIPVNIFKTKQVLISIHPNDFSFIAEENLRDIFSLLAEHKISINLMQNTAISFSVVIDHHPDKLDSLIGDLQKYFKVRYNTGLELITIRNFNETTIKKILAGKKVLLEQKTRYNAQFVARNIHNGK